MICARSRPSHVPPPRIASALGIRTLARGYNPSVTPPPNVRQDEEHLRLLALGFRICGVLLALCCSFGLIHTGFGLTMLSNPGAFKGSGPPPPPFMGALFAFLGGSVVIGGWVLAYFVYSAAKWIERREGHTAVLVISGLLLLFQPLGMALGIMSFIVLLRPSVQALFARDDRLSQ